MAYTDVTRVDCLPSVGAGETAQVIVYIKNLYTKAIGIKVRAVVNGTIDVDFAVIQVASALPGYTYYFSGFFTMPNADAVIRAESYYYGVDGEWHFEDYQTATIKLEPSDVYGGTITDFYFKKGATTYRQSNGQIPAVVSADGQSFEIGVDFKASATSPGSFFARCKVVVTDPNGIIHSPTPDRAGISPGQTLTNWGPFQLPAVTTPGQWQLLIQYLLDDGTIIASWGKSVLFSTPQNTGVITKQWVNKSPEGNNLSMPVSVNADGNTFEIGVEWKNNCTNPYNAHISILVANPVGGTISKVSDNYSMSPGQVRSKEFDIAAVDKSGLWICYIRLITDKDVPLAEFDGICLNAIGASGAITSMWFNQGSHKKVSFGTEVDADGQNLEVGVQYKNTSTRSVTAGVQVDVYDPSGIKQPTPAVDYAGMGTNKELQKEYQFGKVDKVGEWTAELTFLEKDTNTVLARWPASGSGLLLRALTVASYTDVKILTYRKKTPSALATPIEVAPGDVIEVDVSITYSAPASRTANLIAGLIISPGFDYPVSHQITLAAGVNVTKTVTVEIPITDDVGLKNDTYDLRVEIGNLSDQVGSVIAVTGMPKGILGGLGDIGNMLIMMMVVMMMTMMMEQTRDLYEPAGTLPRPKPVSEAVVKGAKKAAEYTGRAVKRVTEYYSKEGKYD